jgi:hypothetical protein
MPTFFLDVCEIKVAGAIVHRAKTAGDLGRIQEGFADGGFP